MVFRKNLRSLERRWEKISKFLGYLPSEQIFYRNIPLGAPAHCHGDVNISKLGHKYNQIDQLSSSLRRFIYLCQIPDSIAMLRTQIKGTQYIRDKPPSTHFLCMSYQVNVTRVWLVILFQDFHTRWDFP